MGGLKEFTAVISEFVVVADGNIGAVSVGGI